MGFLHQSPTMRSSLSLFGQLGFLVCMINAVSIWDPFCREDILYTPYVRVFQKGRSGVILRDRGPGFIDLSGMKDVYICTNGLIMLYYTKTKGMGEVYEQGELHWSPHHCELYNPSSNNGMKADHPKKKLLSILLIGHPRDYRRPAMQMFVAPVFDTSYGDYINITSLIMMGTDGECLIEKGSEKARLRIRNQHRKGNGTGDTPKPPIFCQLDAQRKLGQRGFITLAKPGKAGMESAQLYEFKKRPPGFKGTPLEKVRPGHPSQKSDMGSKISPRYRPSNLNFPGELASIADMADDVYTALINDRKMRFVGCLRYPDFNVEQMRIIETRKIDSEKLNLETEGLLIKDSEPPFWAEKVNVPWPDSAEPKTNDARYTLYMGVDVSSGDVESYDDAEKKVGAALNETKAKREAKAEEAEIKAADDALTKERMLFSLWPLKKAYGDLYKHVKDIEGEVKNAWAKVHEETFHDLTDFSDWTDPENKKASVIAHWKQTILRNISQTKYERRFEPYDRRLVAEYDKYIKEVSQMGLLLRKKSIALGPMISSAETLHGRYRVYKTLLKQVLQNLQQGVRQLERSGKAVDTVTKDPFDMSFVDTMIEITDAVKEDMTPVEDNMNARACYELPTQHDACTGIKPSSERAAGLLKNRQGKGKDWPVEDQWRGKVLDLVEEIFENVCPYMHKDFASSITRIVKGYLLADPLGTGLNQPISGSRLYSVDHHYQAIVYNMTYSQTSIVNMTDIGAGKLRPMQPFWNDIMTALEECKDKAIPMQFWHNEEGDRPAYVTYRKFFRNNNSEAHYDVEELMMQEKADLEYSFNYAVDLNWRIFATVLGICMPRYEYKIPLISARFYSLYSKDFLHPLRQIWMSNRDNPVLHTILGNYYNRGKGERWAKICMESAFMESGDRNYRPPRSLYVNAFTEMNYFTTGPLAGTCGILSVAGNAL